MIAGFLALLLIALFWAFLKFTLTGRAIRAMGQDRDAASIACAGAAEVALAMVVPFSPNTQVQWLAWAFLVVILGGLGKVENTLAAGLVVGLIQTVCTALLPFDYVYLVLYLLLAAILILRREGLSRAARRAI